MTTTTTARVVWVDNGFYYDPDPTDWTRPLTPVRLPGDTVAVRKERLARLVRIYGAVPVYAALADAGFGG